MKKILAFFIFLFLLIGLFIALNKKHLSSNREVITYQLNNKSYKLYTAKTPAEWEKGLMFYRVERDSGRRLDNADGMIFIFPNKEIRSFWNKNTFMNLKLYWLNDDNVVGEDYLPPIEKSKKTVTVSSPSKVNKVIEIVENK